MNDVCPLCVGWMSDVFICINYWPSLKPVVTISSPSQMLIHVYANWFQTVKNPPNFLTFSELLLKVVFLVANGMFCNQVSGWNIEGHQLGNFFFLLCRLNICLLLLFHFFLLWLVLVLFHFLCLICDSQMWWGKIAFID